MSIRKQSFVFGEFYHIYNRGNSKQVIFRDKGDYYRFIRLLYLSNTQNKIIFNRLNMDFVNLKKDEKIVNIGAYCLMPNHFHILIAQTEDGDISRFMQKISTAYSMYYNKKYNRTGSLFEGKFKSEHVADDRYLKYLFSYIHLNPVKIIQSDWKEKGINNKTEALKFLETYKYSSYLDYLGFKRLENKILDIEAFPNYFPTKEIFQNEIFEWLSYQEDVKVLP